MHRKRSPEVLALKCLSDLTSLDTERDIHLLCMNSQTTQWTLSMFMQISNMRAVRNTLSACANFLHGCCNSRTLCRYIRICMRAGAPNFREIYVARKRSC